jgi:hypothetical protein
LPRARRRGIGLVTAPGSVGLVQSARVAGLGKQGG